MPVPTYDKFIEPILRHLAIHPEGLPAREVHEAAAVRLALSHQDREEVIPSGQAIYKNRSGWAHDRLKRAGLSFSPSRGFWCLTHAGQDFCRRHPEPLSPTLVNDIASKYNNVGLGDDSAVPPSVEAAPESPLLVPEDRIYLALRDIETSVAADLLERLAQVSPTNFETIVLDLLHRMGYGAKREDLQRTQQGADGGIDGIVSLDALGLEKVYVQAKRWQNCVGRPEIQAFYGALAGHRATKGVFLTTSNFSKQAVAFADSIERIVLVDGDKLARLMIAYGVGVSHRQLRIPSLDGDYFEDL